MNCYNNQEGPPLFPWDLEEFNIRRDLKNYFHKRGLGREQKKPTSSSQPSFSLLLSPCNEKCHVFSLYLLFSPDPFLGQRKGKQVNAP